MIAFSFSQTVTVKFGQEAEIVLHAETIDFNCNILSVYFNIEFLL